MEIQNPFLGSHNNFDESAIYRGGRGFLGVAAAAPMGPATNTDVFGRLLAPDPEHHDFITGDVLHQVSGRCTNSW